MTVQKILYANVHVQPDNSYSTTESGTRHRTAERAAKHLKREVVAISESKKRMLLYTKEIWNIDLKTLMN